MLIQQSHGFFNKVSMPYFRVTWTQQRDLLLTLILESCLVQHLAESTITWYLRIWLG